MRADIVPGAIFPDYAKLSLLVTSFDNTLRITNKARPEDADGFPKAPEGRKLRE
jgi:hypothetical protein